MGRKKKYITEEEKLKAQKRWYMEHYERNKEVIKEKNRKRYHAKKNNHRQFYYRIKKSTL